MLEVKVDLFHYDIQYEGVKFVYSNSKRFTDEDLRIVEIIAKGLKK